MNTDTTTTKVTKPGTVRRTALLLTTALALFAGLSAVGATQASAATTGNVTFCLKSGATAPWASKPVYLYWANPGGSFQYWKSGSTNAQGCATWKGLPTGFYYRTEGYLSYNVGSQVWYLQGWTGYGYLSGSSLTLATGSVQGPFRQY